MKVYKILHIITRSQRGGAEINTFETIKGLADFGFDCDLMVGRDSDMEFAKNNINKKIFINKYLIRAINPIKDIIAFFVIYKLIKKEKYDIVHTHLAKAGILGRLAAKLAGAPVIIHTLHGTIFHQELNPITRKIYIMFERWLARYTDCIISVGYDLKNKYLQAGIGKDEQYKIVRSGMDLDRFYNIQNKSEKDIAEMKASFSFSESDIIVGMAASLEPRKGHKYVIDVAQKIIAKNKDVKLVFAGDGYLKEQIKEEIKKGGLEDNIKLLGFLNNIEDFFAICDVVILTSLWEGLPQVLVQAAASGRPMVSFDVEGVKEIIRDGINGFIVPIKNIEMMAEKINFLISDLERARSMGFSGRDIVGDEWRVESMVGGIAEIYREKLSSGSPN